MRGFFAFRHAAGLESFPGEIQIRASINFKHLLCGTVGAGDVIESAACFSIELIILNHAKSVKKLSYSPQKSTRENPTFICHARFFRGCGCTDIIAGFALKRTAFAGLKFFIFALLCAPMSLILISGNF